MPEERGSIQSEPSGDELQRQYPGLHALLNDPNVTLAELPLKGIWLWCLKMKTKSGGLFQVECP